MDSEGIKAVGAILGPLIAIGSLIFNVYQFRENNRLRNTAPLLQRKEELRTSLKAVVGRMSSSFIFKVDPHYENWERGFPSLEAFRDISEAANTLFVHSSLPPSNIKMIIQGLFLRTMAVLAFRDSLDRFRGPRERLYPDDYAEWPEELEAEEALKELQKFAKSYESRLGNHLRKMTDSARS